MTDTVFSVISPFCRGSSYLTLNGLHEGLGGYQVGKGRQKENTQHEEISEFSLKWTTE